MKLTIILGVCVLVITGVIMVTFQQSTTNDARHLSEFPADEIIYRGVVEGREVVVIKGEVYALEGDDSLELLGQLYDPDYYEKNYLTEDGVLYQYNPVEPSERIEVKRELNEGFEAYVTLADLKFDNGGLWNFIHLRSPAVDTAQAENDIVKCIIRGECQFENDSVVTPSTERIYKGTTALKLVAPEATRSLVVSKSSVQSKLIHFREGDDVWYSAWYYLEAGLPYTIMDLESTWLAESAGIRVTVDDAGALGMELKFGAKPKWTQSEPRLMVPRNKWFNVVVYLRLDSEAGIVEVWQDGVKVIAGRGQTLPLPDTIYNALEVGITANTDYRGKAVMYLDEVVITETPLIQ